MATEELKEHAKEEIFEKLADIEHRRWSRWQAYLHAQCEEMIQQGNRTLIIPSGLVERWERQIATPYHKLTEQEKQSDRNEVEGYWHLIDSLIDKTVQMTEERIIGLLKHYTIKCRENSRIADLTTEQFISLITNKSNINK